MGLAADLLSLARHPTQPRALLQWKLHQLLYTRNIAHENPTTKTCFAFLDSTGRSFSAVIQELHPSLLMPVCIFYLILRGLDTIEDDTSIPLATKEPLLRTFANILSQDVWTFDGNRREEKDRELLVQFDIVVVEFKNLEPVYQDIIRDVTRVMGNGMGDFVCKDASSSSSSIDTVAEYDLYCWYVAGVVGEGLTRLFVAAGLSNAHLLEQPELYTSMGLLLQKNNIIRDIHADHFDDRDFWPAQIWSKHVSSFPDLFLPSNTKQALSCSSEMILDALKHVCDCLE